MSEKKIGALLTMKPNASTLELGLRVTGRLWRGSCSF